MPPPVAPLLGEFEVLMLMAALHLTERGEDANGSAIRAEIEARTSRPVPRGSIYVTLDRLEDKRLLTSRMAGSPIRGQRPRRIFRVTPAGVRAVRTAMATFMRMRAGLEPVLGDS
jgi:DNA-binding PadR family transcriptional regulator